MTNHNHHADYLRAALARRHQSNPVFLRILARLTDEELSRIRNEHHQRELAHHKQVH